MSKTDIFIAVGLGFWAGALFARWQAVKELGGPDAALTLLDERRSAA